MLASEIAKSYSYPMNKPLLCFGVFLCTAATIPADLVIVEKVDGSGGSHEMTLKVKGNKIRTDVAPQMSMITDTTTGDVLNVMHAQKMFMRIKGSQAQQLMQEMQGQTKQQPITDGTAAPKLQDTGKQEKVGNFDTQIYTLENGTMKATYWIGKNVPGGDELRTVLKAFQKTPMASIGAAMMQQLDFPGIPIKTEIELGSGQKMTVTLTSVKQQQVSGSDMNVPAGYKELPTPAFPTQ